MKLLYVFPHPDDESFGPALAISRQRRDGHEVCLLTLTRGGATKMRHKFGHTIEQMGEVRLQELEEVAKVLDLADLTVLDFADSGLKELDPRVLEDAVARHIRKIQPQIVVTYPVHGISGFHDHIVTYAVVKRVFLALKDEGAAHIRRLAFITLPESFSGSAPGIHKMHYSTAAEIDCVVPIDGRAKEDFHRALDCYVTYQEMIDKTGVRKATWNGVSFEIFQEEHSPPLTDLC
ncbi:MAG: PIG-L family deacetylase, partial [Planctomycetota bacterium]|nr:PIG-L family deacetylase [Planctomycetota bacterium]